MRVADYALMAVMAVSFSSAAILVVLSGAPGPVAATWRLIISSAIVAILAWARGSISSLLKLSRRDLMIALAGGLFLAMHFDLWMTSLRYISVAVSVTLVDSYPAVLIVVGLAFFKEKYRPLEVLGSAIAMVGVALLSLSDPGDSFAIGVLLSLGGMAAMVLYLSVGKSMRTRLDTFSYVTAIYAPAAAFSAAASLALGYNLLYYSVKTWLCFLGLALVPMMGGHTVMNYLIGRRNFIASTIAMMAEPVGSAVLAYLILGQSILFIQYVYMAVTLAGIGLAVVPQG
ncbi:DMT family transporter [Acidilobus saccharovorans]|nr:DMT family transporter [Acidilobus saccharovorans]